MSTATVSPTPAPVTITIPAEHLERFRTALIAEIADDGDCLTGHDNTAVGTADRAMNARILERDMQLLAQILDADQDAAAAALPDVWSQALQGMIRTQVAALADEAQYGPLDRTEVRSLVDALGWAIDMTDSVNGGRDWR